MRTEQSVLFLFAHQDDEYAAAPWLLRERANGAVPSCVYLTDGASRVPAHVRDAESRNVLIGLGVSAENIAFLGNDERIADGALAERLDEADGLLRDWVAAHGAPVRVYMPDWEGGHPDHDALHLLGLRCAARARAAGAWAFSIYNAYRCPKPFFSCLRLLPGGERTLLAHSWAAGWQLAMLCWRYRSQVRTWIGLFPGAFYQRVLLRRESIRRCDPKRIAARPHPGELLYERLFGMSYTRFAELTASFWETSISDPADATGDVREHR